MGKKFVAVILGAVILRLLLYRYLTYNLDLYLFVEWADRLVEVGLKNFYATTWSDYLPGYLYILWLLGTVRKLGTVDPLLLFKLPAILSDVATGGLIYLIVAKLKNRKLATFASALYLFNPAVFANSTLWGQADSLVALFSLLTVHLFGVSPVFSAISLALGTVVKPTVAYVAPVIVVLMVKNRWSIKKIVTYVLAGAVVFIAGFLPFTDKNVLAFMVERIGITTNQYPYGSVNAFNFWGLWGFWKPDQTLGLTFLIPLIFVGIEAIRSWKKETLPYRLLVVAFASVFLFLTRMHERHLLPVFAPLIIVALTSTPAYLMYFGLSLTYLANLYYAYSMVEGPRAAVFDAATIKILIAANLVLFGNFVSGLGEKIRAKIKIPKIASLAKALPQLKLQENSRCAVLVVILLFSLVTRLGNLGHPKGEYFDEVYHAFTARQLLNGDPRAWEWWNAAPEGYAYEWTHPPFAKLAMVVGMNILGENSFGWRAPGAFFGVGVIYLIYLIAKKLSGDEALALIAAGAASLDGLLVVLSRVGMNDTYFVFFALASFYFFFARKHFFSALFFGLAAASKWSAVWLVPILFAVFLSQKRKFSFGYLWFLIIPPVVYLASYIPMFTSGHSWGEFIEVQRQMWWYHSHLKATHAYQSLWWSWPAMLRPVWFYAGRTGNWVENIYAMGNPFIFFSGVAAAVLGALTAFYTKNKNLSLVLFAYLAFFVPWAASPRIMFLYHYLPAIPFMAILIAYVLRRFPKLILSAFTLYALTFIYFFPHWTGIALPQWLSSSYYWFPSWR